MGTKIEHQWLRAHAARTRRGLALYATTLACALVLIATPQLASAQSENPSGFTLRPGPQQEPPPSNVQGPVDAESNPPHRTDEPATPTPTPAPTQAPPSIAPVPVPQAQDDASPRQRERAASGETVRPQRTPEESQAEAQVEEAVGSVVAPPEQEPAPTEQTPSAPVTTTPPIATPASEGDASFWMIALAGLALALGLAGFRWRRRSASNVGIAEEPVDVPVETAPTPPLRQPIRTSEPAQPRAPVPAPAAPAIKAAPPAPAEDAAKAPRLLLDYTTLGVDVTLVNAVARYHLGITNMSDITVSNVVLHGAVVQARRGMPPTIDPMMGDSLLPHLQKITDIASGATQRCEGQIRLPLAQIEPIPLQGRLLFVPVVHIWIGYSGPDGMRYAVTQSFVLGEESTPPGPRVGPLRLELGPRRFTGIGQRPLQPA